MMNQVIKYFKLNPKSIFAVDALGALLSAISIILLLTIYPIKNAQVNRVIEVLFVVAVLFSLYSICCYFFVIRNRKHFLLGIIIANIIYSFTTTITALFFHQYISWVLILYFAIEVFFLLILVYIEFRVWKSLFRRL